MWILDTNVISETHKPKPSPSVQDWILSAKSANLYTTVVNIAEIRFGIVMQQAQDRQQILQDWLDQKIRPWFRNRILDADEQSLLRWRVISKAAIANKHPAPSGDLLVAAIAMTNSMAVATRDTAPFAAAGVPTLNPFTGERFNGA
jgi:toxin FitB